MRIGDLVVVKLTSEIGMIVNKLTSNQEGYADGYLVRLPDYSIKKFYEFELMPREN